MHSTSFCVEGQNPCALADTCQPEMSSFSQEIVDAYSYYELADHEAEEINTRQTDGDDDDDDGKDGLYGFDREPYKLTRRWDVRQVSDPEEAKHYYKQPPFLLDPHDELTVSILRPNRLNRQQCSNSTLRPDMQKTYLTRTKRHPDVEYLVEEGYLRGLDVIGSNAGFLMQLSHICVESKLRDCQNEACVQERKAMDKVAPTCDWQGFRDWAIVAMSCQAMFSHEQKLTRAHTHVTRTVLDCVSLLKACKSNRDSFHGFLDGPSRRVEVNLAQACNVIYWMLAIQTSQGIGWKPYSRWDQDFLPLRVTLPQIEKAAQKVPSLDICTYGVWNMVALSARKQSDLPDIVEGLQSSASLRQKGHDYCTPTKCQQAQINSTIVGQLHKCSNSDGCLQVAFPVDLLALSIEHGQGSAWLLNTPFLSTPSDPYIAISHVWSDGTGIGLKAVGTVNVCLFNYFARVAYTLQCKAVWWDTLSIPIERKARSKALNDLHNNYARAEYTIVHDQYLLNTEWTDDGTPCLALVLSPWFTRGWTALELAMSTRVKVLFKGPDANTPIIKDLDKEILASGPGQASRAHWLASSLIRRLRQPIRGVGDLLAILRPRSTSFIRDRTIISGLLAGLPDCDYSRSETEITRDILTHVGSIPHTILLHGQATMCDSGPFSWSAATLDDMPVDISMADEGRLELKRNTTVDVDHEGAVIGLWYYREVKQEDLLRSRIVPQGQSLAALIKIKSALRRWPNCLIIRQYKSDQGPALLVCTVGVGRDDEAGCSVIDCRYVGVVREISSKYTKHISYGRRRRTRNGSNQNETPVWRRTVIRIGKENGRPDTRASKIVKLQQSKLSDIEPDIESDTEDYKKPQTMMQGLAKFQEESSDELDDDFDEDLGEDTDEDGGRDAVRYRDEGAGRYTERYREDFDEDAGRDVRYREDFDEDAGRDAVRHREDFGGDFEEETRRRYREDSDEDEGRNAGRDSPDDFDRDEYEKQSAKWDVTWEGVKRYKRSDIAEETAYGQEEMVLDSNETKARHLFLAVQRGNVEAARHLIHSGVRMTAENRRELTAVLGAERLSAFLRL